MFPKLRQPRARPAVLAALALMAAPALANDSSWSASQRHQSTVGNSGNASGYGVPSGPRTNDSAGTTTLDSPPSGQAAGSVGRDTPDTMDTTDTRDTTQSSNVNPSSGGDESTDSYMGPVQDEHPRFEK